MSINSEQPGVEMLALAESLKWLKRCSFLRRSVS